MASQRMALRSFASKARAAKSESSSIPSAFIDESRLPFVKYVVSEPSWRRFRENKATTEERKKVVEALKTFLPRRPSQLVALDAAQEALRAQSVVPTVQGKTQPETPAEMLARIKPNVLEMFGVEESQYDKVAEEVLKAYNENGGAGNGEDGNIENVETPTGLHPTLVANPCMTKAQRATIQSIINEITR